MSHSGHFKSFRLQPRDRLPFLFHTRSLKAFAALEQQGSRSVVWAAAKRGLETSDSTHEVAMTIFREPFIVERDPGCVFAANVLYTADQLVDRKSLCASIDSDAVDFAGHEGTTN